MYAQSGKVWMPNNKKNQTLGASKPKDINRMAKLIYGHLCMREDNLNFD
jgi:hypothetical protein